MLKDEKSGLDVSYPFTVKESGKARVELVRWYNPKLNELR